MTIATNSASVIAGNAFVQQMNDLYIVFAKATPWNDDNAPDSETNTLTTLDDELYYAKVTQRLLVYPTAKTDNVITYGGKNYGVASDLPNAISNNAHYVLLTTNLKPNTANVNDFTFRQLGIKSGVKTTSTDLVINANQVTDKGILLYYANRKPQAYLAKSTNLTVKYLIDFETLIK